MREDDKTGIPKKTFHHSDGMTYFDKKTERQIFFVLTLAMLAWGVLTKLGVL
jgi:hypothetical protein